MTKRLWTVLLGAILTLAACRSAGSPPAPGQPSPGAGVPPAVPNPAPAPPQPVMTPVTPVPTAPPSAAMAPAQSRPYQDILKLKQTELTDEFLFNKVRTETVPYPHRRGVPIPRSGLEERRQQARHGCDELFSPGVSDDVLLAARRQRTLVR
jgi:hypothetical protein